MAAEAVAQGRGGAAAWEEFEDGLTAYLGSMVDPEEQDHLILELPVSESDDEGATAPYVQFAGFGEAEMLRIEVSGDAYLHPDRRLAAAARAYLTDKGWCGNDEAEKNWYLHCPVDEGAKIAGQVVVLLRSHLGVVRPTELTYQAWGPAAEEAYLLGLDQTRDDEDLDMQLIELRDDLDETPHLALAPSNSDDSVFDVLAHQPDDRGELVEVVGQLLREKYDDVSVDDDGDFVLHDLHDLAWVRVHEDVPAIEVMARVAHDVPSRRSAAVEISLLNRDHVWVNWQLRGRTVWQVVILPGLPFVPIHLSAMLSAFEEALAKTRDDLTFRLRAKVG